MSRYLDIDPNDYTAANGYAACFMCSECGVMVVDTELHDKYHEDMIDVADSARRADLFTRPIG